ncbi:MAG: alpha/beta hydrolase [Hyphomicrobiaceae bacterium]|nr:alpha/beta hydrolase [Hyphomicrobiaceae bacterium]
MWRCIAALASLFLSICIGALPSAAADNFAYRKYHVTVSPAGHPPLRLYAEEAGRGPPVVLLHGLAGSAYTWRRVVRKMAQHHRLIAIDLKGHGRSDKPFDENYSANDQAAIVYAFLRQRRLRSITLAGHSFGGQVAVVLAIQLQRVDPKLISRLVLLDAPLFPQRMTWAISLLRKPVLPYIALSVVPSKLAAEMALMSEIMGFGRITDRDIDIYSEPYGDAAARHALIQTALQIVPRNSPQLIRRYRSVRQPTLLIWCRHDNVVPLSTGRRMLKTMRNARLAILERCNHVPLEQRPGAVAKLIRSFAAR